MLHRQRTAVSERAKNPRSAVAVAQLRVQRDDFVKFRFEVREIRPGQFEFNLHAARSPVRGNFDADFPDRFEKTRTQTETRLHVCPFQTGPVAMYRARRSVRGPGLTAKGFVLARVEIPFHAVAFPEVIVVREIGRCLVQRPQTGVKRLFVPQVEELRGAIAQRLRVEAAIFDRRAESVLELGQVAVDFHVLRRPRGQAANARNKLRRSRVGEKQKEQNGQKRPPTAKESDDFHGLIEPQPEHS